MRGAKNGARESLICERQGPQRRFRSKSPVESNQVRDFARIGVVEQGVDDVHRGVGVDLEVFAVACVEGSWPSRLVDDRSPGNTAVNRVFNRRQDRPDFAS